MIVGGPQLKMATTVTFEYNYTRSQAVARIADRTAKIVGVK